MCMIIENKKPIKLNSILGKYDPTKTTTIRLAFMREVKKRFNKIISQIKEKLVEEDYLRLKVNQYSFPLSEDKIKGFMDWLKKLEEKELFKIVSYPGTRTGISSQWTDKYIAFAYTKGIARARQEMISTGLEVPSLSEYSVQLSLKQPAHLDRIGIIYARVFEDLKGITSAMDAQISRVLADGMIQGLGPRDIAKSIAEKIDSIGISRATTLARTEVIRAHHLANINEYRQYGIELVGVKAEWRTVGDNRVCELCAPRDGKIYSLDKIEPLIPLHPNCRCMAVPIIK